MISSSLRRPAASPASTAPSSRHVVAPSDARPRRRGRARRCGSPAPSRRRRRASRASSSTAISALPGPSAPIRLTCWPGRSEPRRARPRGPASPSTTRSAASASLAARRRRRRRARRPRLAARSASTSQSTVVAAAREERPRRCAPVHACADHGRVAGVRAPERLRGEHRGRAGPQAPSPRPRRAPPRSIPSSASESSTTPAHRRQPARRVARERRHPLEQRVPGAERRHRAEVAGRVVRARTPSAASSTRRARRRRTRRAPPRPPRSGDTAGSTCRAAKNGTPRKALDAASARRSAPSLLRVAEQHRRLRSKKSGLSMPAKPGPSTRFMTTTSSRGRLRGSASRRSGCPARSRAAGLTTSFAPIMTRDVRLRELGVDLAPSPRAGRTARSPRRAARSCAPACGRRPDGSRT